MDQIDPIFYSSSHKIDMPQEYATMSILNTTNTYDYYSNFLSQTVAYKTTFVSVKEDLH